jgi:hypothetical protein
MARARDRNRARAPTEVTPGHRPLIRFPGHLRRAVGLWPAPSVPSHRRLAADHSTVGSRRGLTLFVRFAVWAAFLCVVYLSVTLGIWAVRRDDWPFFALAGADFVLITLLATAFAWAGIQRLRMRRQT